MIVHAVSVFLQAHAPGELFLVYARDVGLTPSRFDAMVRDWVEHGVDGYALLQVHVLNSRTIEYCQLQRHDE